MRDVSVGIAADLLMPSLYERFAHLFSVASRKSVLRWKEVSCFKAEVLLLDRSLGPQMLPVKAPCVICVGGAAPGPAANAPWVARLDANYTLADLIDVLDRAAVFLLDWRARQKSAAPAVGAAVAAAPEDAARYAYQLSTWVSMGAPFNSGGCVRALALLSREPVTLRQLCEHSGLERATAHALLAQLGRRGVLRSVPLAGAGGAAAPKARPRISGGLVQRLARWVRSGGRA